MIVFDLCIEGISHDAVHDEPVHMLGAEVMAYSALTKSAWSASFVTRKDGSSSEPAPVDSSLVNETILTALPEHRFLSIHKLSRGTCLLRSTVPRRLTQSLGFKIRRLG
jgi:hypothetical protein